MDVYITLKIEDVLLDHEDFREEVINCVEGFFGSDIGAIEIEEYAFNNEMEDDEK